MIDVFAAGCVAVLVTVCAPAVLLTDEDLAPAPVVALEIAPFASLAALDAALVAEPDPQPARTVVAPPSASAAKTSDMRTVDVIAFIFSSTVNVRNMVGTPA